METEIKSKEYEELINRINQELREDRNKRPIYYFFMDAKDFVLRALRNVFIVAILVLAFVIAVVSTGDLLKEYPYVIGFLVVIFGVVAIYSRQK